MAGGVKVDGTMALRDEGDGNKHRTQDGDKGRCRWCLGECRSYSHAIRGNRGYQS
jgi:hypothetical protein